MLLNSPDFLCHVDVSKEDLQRIAPKLKNWKSISSCYASVTEKELEKFIIIELNYKCRKSILKRLITRYSQFKKRKYEESLIDFLGGSWPEETVKVQRFYDLVDTLQ